MIETLILRFQFHYVTEIVTPLPALNPYPCAPNNWFLSLTGFFRSLVHAGRFSTAHMLGHW
jgi:hypothetical protein